jgi:hypothetical protein
MLPQASGRGRFTAGDGLGSAGSGSLASQAEIADTSARLRRVAMLAMQSGALAWRLPLRQAPNWALM